MNWTNHVTVVDMLLGKTILELRMEHKLRIVDLADRTGMSESRIQAIETGKTYVNGKVLAAVAMGLNITVDDITSRAGVQVDGWLMK